MITIKSSKTRIGLLIAGAGIIAVGIFKITASLGINKPEHEAELTTTIVDSIETSDGKIPDYDFYDEYGTSEWFTKYNSNKVAFDMEYDNKEIDVSGTISEIKTSWGCSIIEMSVPDRSAFDVISFSNCSPEGDRWSEEVAKVRVGEDAHIRGIYWGGGSSEYEMNITHSHIIP